MKQELIEKIEGGNRWTRGDKDRLYFNDEELGLKKEHYKTGRISGAEIVEWPYLEGADMEAVNEEVGEISNSRAYNISGGKHYIDLDTGKINSYGFFKARIEYLVLKAKKTLEAEGKNPEGEDPEMSKMSLSEFKKWVIAEIVKEQIADYWCIPAFLTDKYIKNFLSIKKTEKVSFALVEIDIQRRGYRRGSYLWRIAVNLKRKRFELTQDFYKNNEGEIKEERNIFEKDKDRQMKEFEEAHIWIDWTEENPADPTPINSIKKSAKKMTEEEAVSALTEAKTAEAVQMAIKKTKKEVLMKIARAVENIIEIHVKSNAGRSTLERVLVDNAEKLMGVSWNEKIEEYERVCAIKKWNDEMVRTHATPEILQNFTHKQLEIVGKTWGVKIRMRATKIEKIAVLIESRKAVA